jgi:phosphoribosylanthranilate isomerase
VPRRNPTMERYEKIDPRSFENIMWVKICGIRDVPTARTVAECRPDAIGLNFHPPSPRFVELNAAKQIAKTIPEEVQTVGVFVNPPLCEIAAAAYGLRLDFAQLHGDESPEFLAEIHESLPMLRLIRAWRMGPEGLDEWSEYFDRCRELGVPIFACLLDARVEGIYGGSGKTVAWDVVAQDFQTESWPRLILAGGLSPGNIRQAIESVHPWGVDVASGVESSPSVKDCDLVREFIASARQTV